MSNVPLSYLPGVCKVDSAYADSMKVSGPYASGKPAMGRFTDMQWVRFVAGTPEKIIPPAQLTSNFFELFGYGGIRAYKDWRDNASNKYLAAGTDFALLVYSKKTDSYTDVTPLRPTVGNSSTLTNALSTTQGSPVITVLTSLAAASGDHVYLGNGTPIGGISLNGYYPVISVNPGVSFTVKQAVVANATVVGGGGTLTYAFPRGSGSNLLFTVSGNPTVVVVFSGPVSIGDWVFLSNSSPVGGITLNGWYCVTGINAGVSFNVTASINASSTVSGGGGTVTYMTPRVVISNPFTTTISSASVKVTISKHGMSAGDRVYWSGGTTVGGINLTTDQRYMVTSIIDQDNFTITANSAAGSNASGGGSVTFQFGITFATASTPLPSMWTLSPYGQQLLACPSGTTIYIFDPSVQPGGALTRAYPLLNAPQGVIAMFVTPERFVMALGQINDSGNFTGSAMTVAWPDQSDYTNWTSTPTNSANSGRTLQEGTALIGGMAVRDGIAMVFTDTAAYVFTYTGDNFIYSDTLAGRNCGAVGPQAMIPMNNLAFWFSGKEYYSWNGSVAPLQSDDIRDYVVKDLDTANAYKSCLGTWLAYQEIWHMYPSVADGLGENTRYVVYHTNQNCWSSGYTDNNPANAGVSPVRSFSAWLDSPLFMYPIMSWWLPSPGSPSNANFFVEIFNQNINNSNSGGDYSSLTFSPMDISKGDKNMDVFCFIPDFQLFNDALSQMRLTINTQDYPSDAITANGPYQIGASQFVPNSRIDLRIGTKLLGYTIADSEQASGSLWRLGVPRIELQPSGARR